MPKYLKGFSNFGVRPVTQNTGESYAVDDTKYMDIPGGQSCSPNDNKTDYSIPADDVVWDSGSEWNYTDLEVTFVETELSAIADVIGVELEDDEMEEGVFDEAPERALSFSALRRDGGYRLFRYYAARCLGYKVSHTTKGQNNDAQAYTFTFRCYPRKCDGKIRNTKDVAKGDTLSWIKTFANGGT